MGLGDNWKAAMEKVKETYVDPGKQPELIRSLAREAEALAQFAQRLGLVGEEAVPVVALVGGRIALHRGVRLGPRQQALEERPAPEHASGRREDHSQADQEQDDAAGDRERSGRVMQQLAQELAQDEHAASPDCLAAIIQCRHDTFDDVVHTLDGVVHDDWATFLRDRLDGRHRRLLVVRRAHGRRPRSVGARPAIRRAPGGGRRAGCSR